MPTVLVVDDEPNIRWTMAELLKREGYETLTSSDFDSAISLIESSMPDAAVVDIVLSGRSGIEFLKEVSNRDSYIPVIMITGEPNVSQIPEIVRAGAYDFIPKPVVKDVLLRAVSKAVEKKRLVDQKNKLEQQIKRHAEELEVLVQERTRELAEAHNFLNAVLDSSTEYAIIATDIEGRIVLFNRGAELMLGYSFEQMRTSPAGVLFQDESYRTAARPFHKHYQEASAPGGSRLEVEMVRSDGTAFTASAAITQILSSSDQLIGYLSVIKDLTEEREHEEAMRQMQARLARNEKISALGRMAALVAHEVRNPLAGLRLYSLHLRGKVTGKLAPAEVSLIDKIINGINHLSDTVEQVLTFARPVNLTRRPVDINQIVTSATQLLEPQIASGKIDVRLDLIESGATALIDEPSMRSVVMNLMLNSIQAMKDGGKLTVTTTRSEEGINLEVADTGEGMTAEQTKNLFEPFYTTKSQGLGLGMFHAWKVIKLHGGTILIETQVGKGTRIKVTLPAEEKDETSSPHS